MAQRKEQAFWPGIARKALQEFLREWEFPGKVTWRRNGKIALLQYEQ